MVIFKSDRHLNTVWITQEELCLGQRQISHTDSVLLEAPTKNRLPQFLGTYLT